MNGTWALNWIVSTLVPDSAPTKAKWIALSTSVVTSGLTGSGADISLLASRFAAVIVVTGITSRMYCYELRVGTVK